MTSRLMGWAGLGLEGRKRSDLAGVPCWGALWRDEDEDENAGDYGDHPVVQKEEG